MYLCIHSDTLLTIFNQVQCRNLDLLLLGLAPSMIFLRKPKKDLVLSSIPSKILINKIGLPVSATVDKYPHSNQGNQSQQLHRF